MDGTKLKIARELDAELRAHTKEMRRGEALVAFGLSRMEREGLHLALGFSRVQDYAERSLEVSRGKAVALVQLAADLERLPVVRAAFERGEIDWTKAREVAKVATAKDEAWWVARAKEITSRRLEAVVATMRGVARKSRVTIQFTGEEIADFDDMIAWARGQRGEALELGAALQEVWRQLRGPARGRARHQVVIHECGTCGRAERPARGGAVPLDAAALAAAKDDAEIIDTRTGERKATIKPRERALVTARAGASCEMCGARGWLEFHHVRPEGGAKYLIALCWQCHHQVVHQGHVIVEGCAPAFTFRLADGTPWTPPDESAMWEEAA